MELCINQSLRRIVDIAEMGSVISSAATTKSQKVKNQALSISTYFGIFNRRYKVERVGLPEVATLSHEQAGSLANALENAFNALGKIVAFPANLPLHMRYTFLRDLWLDDWWTIPPVTAPFALPIAFLKPCRAFPSSR